MMKRYFLATVFPVIIVGIFCACLGAEDKPAWQVDWERTLLAAKKEGQVVIYAATGPYHPGIFAGFQKDHPDIKAVTVSGRSEHIAPRLLAERRADKYLADIYMGGPTSLYSLFYRQKRLDPITPLFILPEVADPSYWWEGKHYYVDPEGKSIFVNEGSVSGLSIVYNTRLLKPREIESAWDLLSIEWNGKIIATDARQPGLGASELRFIYYHPEMGPDFIRRLFGEMDIVLSRDWRQAIDWIATGKFAICVFCRSSLADDAAKKGLPVGSVNPNQLKEMPRLRGSASTIAFMNRAPHPNAAKVFINWFLSRRGQIIYQESHGDRDSLRVDIPKERVPVEARRIAGRKYLFVEGPEFMDENPALKVMDEALKSRKKSR